MIPDNVFLITALRSSDSFHFSLFNASGPFLVTLQHNLYLLVHSASSDSQPGACDPDVCCGIFSGGPLMVRKKANEYFK